MDNKKRLCLEDAVTNAEIYAVKVIEEELNRKGIAPNSIERKIIITRTADVLAAHREEVRDMSESEASECRASDYFNIKVDESAEAVAACVGYMIDRFKHAPAGMKTETAEDIEARQQQADETEEILGDLYMYGI